MDFYHFSGNKHQYLTLGLIPHFYVLRIFPYEMSLDVSMPSRAYTSFLHIGSEEECSAELIAVSMPSRAYTSFLLRKLVHQIETISMCQCPLGLIPHFYLKISKSQYAKFRTCVNALSGLYLISTVPLQKPRFYAVSRACFCRYLSEYSDNSRFSCMLTFWTYLMRCTYPRH